ncbi:MAG TPA: NADP-dependent oxidoreductase [Thermoplasmata archaeon]|nr:NADP-dependent oxidoreductase [Thermoplasmata archaeon]
MRAVAVRKFKDTPTLMDLPKPSPGPGEILVQLGAAGINPFDWKVADGAFEGRMPHVFPLILGVDGAGVVEAIGAGVTRFAVGDGVYGQFFHAPVGIGTYAEYVVAPEHLGIAKMPRGMYSGQAAAVPTAGMTALDAIDKLALPRGKSLLILGAGGGVGSFAVQLASNSGLLALAASRTGRNRDFLHKLGAHRYFDSENMRFVEEVKMAYPDGVDAILDLVNTGDAFTKNLSTVRKGGVVVSTIGAATEEAVGPHGLKGININLQPKAELLDRLAAEFSTGRLRVPLEETVPLAEAPQAVERARTGVSHGKVVLKI